MGDYTLERIIIIGILFLLTIAAAVFTKKKRKVAIGLIIVVLAGYLLFFFVRGRVLENEYKQSIEVVSEYLQSQFPEEEWTVIDRLEKGQKRRSNKVDIVFENEKEVIYTYKKTDNNQVVQWEVNIGEKNIDELKHNQE